MLYIVGGASRCGKTMLAQRMMKHHSVPWFSLDGLRMGLSRGAPVLGLDPERDDLVEAENLWPVIEALLDNVLAWSTDYLFEGSCLRPQDVARFIAQRRDQPVRAVFLGAPDLSVAEQLERLNSHRGQTNDWLKNTSPDERRAHAERIVRDSGHIRDQARAANLTFIDASMDFETAQAEALAFLMKDQATA